MTDEFTSVVKELEQRRAALEKAIAALRAIDDAQPDRMTSRPVPNSANEPEAWATARKGKKRSAAVRKRMAEAQRQRWAKVRGGSQ